MKRSPLLYSFSLIASLSLLTIGSAWSATVPQEKPKSTAKAKAKTLKAKASKIKSVKKAAPIKLASADLNKFVPTAARAVTTTPYIASQPQAVLPKTANPYLANPGISVPVASIPVISAPVTSTLAAVAPAVAITAATAPSAAQSVTASAPAAVQAPAAAMPTNSPVAAYQSWNNAPISKNPYLAYQYQSAPPAPAAVYNPFGNGVKVASLSLPQTANPTPPPTPWTENTATAAMTNTTQSAIADASNSFNQIFTSLKMALPSLPQPVVTPTQTALSGTSNSFNQLFTSLKMALPSGPLSGDTTYLPVIKTVYPTGEKPLVVLNFKCPTEMVGITPPPMKLLHEAINLGFDGLNKTNLLSFNLQQVCS